MKFPQTIYVKQEKDDGEHYLTAWNKAEDAAEEVGSSVKVGVYELVRVVAVTTKVEVK